MPHLSPLYRFSDGFVCGFRFWPNFFCGFAVLDDFLFGFAVSNTPQCSPPVLITLLRNPVGSKTVMSSFTQTILRMHSLRSSFKGFLKKSEVEATAAVNRA